MVEKFLPTQIERRAGWSEFNVSKQSGAVKTESTK